MNYNENKKIEEPIYVMTVELEKGKSENIIFFKFKTRRIIL